MVREGTYFFGAFFCVDFQITAAIPKEDFSPPPSQKKTSSKDFLRQDSFI
jgi:hypothetical protein